MVVLKPVLLARELPYSWHKLRQRFPSLREFVQPDPQPRESEILAYLRQGESIGLAMRHGLGRDILSHSEHIDRSLPSGMIFTDGTWAWWGVLPYYVERYHVRLPEEFIAHAESNGWRIGPVTVKEFDFSLFDATDETLAEHPDLLTLAPAS